MGESTGITWAHHTFNGLWGCTEVSPGCDHCYARTWSAQKGYPGSWGVDGQRRTFGSEHWREPLRWNRKAARLGERRRVFAYSMADVFDAHPAAQAALPLLWAVIRNTPHLDWLLLTKRHGRIRRGLPADWGEGYPNVWLGVSVEDQQRADERIPELLSIPAAVHWISAEPLLGPVVLHDYLQHPQGTALRLGLKPQRKAGAMLDWVVVGGESGAQHRDMDPAWLSYLEHQCWEVGTALFVKQDSNYRDGQQGRIPDEVWNLKQFPVPRSAA